MPRVAPLGGVSRRLAVLIATTATILALAGATMASIADAGTKPHLLPDLVTMKVSQATSPCSTAEGSSSFPGRT